ncbi:hypothetical protein C8R42DRAFT_728552 [Lentinula raphanica]|nr:hypothetical protein C8R42DRAFT_728552 [Lentinula raphanica]
MPATRSWARRKSSLGLVAAPPAKPGIYGVQNPEPNRLTFCPNVTPTTFKNEADAEEMYDDSADDSSATLFPPSSTPAPPPRRRRAPPGKRRSLGYIPRPPNAFMLFRADFVKQKHVPNSIETNHSSLSKIIGSCWRSLPVEEKAIWEKRARLEKAEHKRKYPEYRFRPVHNKNKNKTDAPSAPKKVKVDSLPPSLASIEAMRTEREGFIAQCLLDGFKGDALKSTVSQWDDAHGWVEGAEGMAALETRALTPNIVPSDSHFAHSAVASVARYPPRRPSSVPLPNDFLPFQGGIQQPQQYFPQYPDAFSHVPDTSHGLSMDLAGYTGNHVAQSSYNMLPSLNPLRPPSPSPNNFNVASISRQQRMVLGGRRASSAQAFVNYGRPEDSWVPHTNWSDMQGQWVGANWQTGYGGETTGTSPSSSASSLPLQTEVDELPEADTSLFQPGFAFGASSFSAPLSQPSPFDGQQQCNPFEGYTVDQSHDYQAAQQFYQEQQVPFHTPHNISLTPIDTHSYSPLDTSPLSSSSVQSNSPAYTGSPAPSEREEQAIHIHAPQPMHPTTIEDPGMTYHDEEAPISTTEDVVQSGDFLMPQDPPIDSAAAFNDLWKGLSSSGSFAAAMGFSLDPSTMPQTDDFSYQQPSPVLETAGDFHNTNHTEAGAFSGHVGDEAFQQLLQAQLQHDELAIPQSSCCPDTLPS